MTKKKIFILLSLAAIILLVYRNVQYYDFIVFDDHVYVTDNPHILSGFSWDNLVWALTALEAGFWHPLTWLSLMGDRALFGLNPGGYHWTNVVFHLASTLLLFLVLQRMTGALWRSALVAALFALHPLHVESVAWIAARKDVLSGFFWVLTMWLYVGYTEHPSSWRYLGVAFVFILGLMSKPMVVTLPLVLLLLDYWPLERLSRSSVFRLLMEKVPLILLAGDRKSVV
jgi:hypothetical protein